jgi:hypothetical protein
VFVDADVELLALEQPRLASVDGRVAAMWTATNEHLVATPAGAHAVPEAAALSAARATTASHERALWQTIALALGILAGMIAAEIGLAFGIAYLVTGHPY